MLSESELVIAESKLVNIILGETILTLIFQTLRPPMMTCLGLVIRWWNFAILHLQIILASSFLIGFIVGNLLGGYCGGRFGPKRTILASCVPGALGWIIIASSPHLATLVLGRVLSGIAGGFSSSNCSLLVAQYRLLLTSLRVLYFISIVFLLIF